MSKCIGCEHYLFDEINKCNYCNSDVGCIYEPKDIKEIKKVEIIPICLQNEPCVFYDNKLCLKQKIFKNIIAIQNCANKVVRK